MKVARRADKSLFHYQMHEGPQAVAASGNLMVDRLMSAKILLTPIPKIGENAATWKRLLNEYSAELK